MKHIGVFMLFILLVACQKDSNDPHNLGFFSYNDTKYLINSGYQIKFNADEYSFEYGMKIILTSSDITFSENENLFNGVGDALILEIFAESNKDIELGTYNYGVTNENFKFVILDAYINSSINNGSPISLGVDNGLMTIISVENEYQIKLDAYSNENLIITAEFQGELSHIDYSTYFGCEICALNTYEDGILINSMGESIYCGAELVTIKNTQEVIDGKLNTKWECNTVKTN